MTRVNEIRMVKGFFWERLELENFPLDTQELSVVVTSKFTNKEIDLITDPEHSSSIDFKASRIFVDQQKWDLFKFVNIGNVASYDMPNPRDSKSDQNYVIYQNKVTKIHPKYVATCFVARKPGYYVFNAYFIIFLITILSLTTFSINCKLPQARLQTSLYFVYCFFPIKNETYNRLLKIQVLLWCSQVLRLNGSSIGPCRQYHI